MSKSRKKTAAERAAMQFDATLKEILQAAPPRLMQTLVGARVAEVLTVEFPRVRARRPDFVARLADARLLHIEVQSDNDAEMEWRMLEYYFLIRRLYGRPPIQIVLYIGKPALTMAAGIDDADLSFRFRLVDMRQIDADALLASRSIDDNLLAVLCRDADEPRNLRRLFRRLEPLPAKIQTDKLTQLLILSQLRNISSLILREIQAMTNLEYVLRNNPVVQAFVEKEVERIIEEAAAKAAAKAARKAEKAAAKAAREAEKAAAKAAKKAEKAAKETEKAATEAGAKAESTRLVTRMLEIRFGKLPKWAQQKLSAADTATLEAWAERLFQAKTLKDVLQ